MSNATSPNPAIQWELDKAVFSKRLKQFFNRKVWLKPSIYTYPLPFSHLHSTRSNQCLYLSPLLGVFFKPTLAIHFPNPDYRLQKQSALYESTSAGLCHSNTHQSVPKHTITSNTTITLVTGYLPLPSININQLVHLHHRKSTCANQTLLIIIPCLNLRKQSKCLKPFFFPICCHLLTPSLTQKSKPNSSHVPPSLRSSLRSNPSSFSPSRQL